MAIMGLLATAGLYAHELNGKILNQDDLPIEGAGVYNKTNGAYTYSDISGYFELDGISEGDVIFFYSLGYESYEMVVDASKLDATITVTLNESALSLDQVVLVSKVNALSNFVNIDVQANPVKSSQEVLRKVPGLIIGQHAGGGKAEQIFLRGFDVDHGTDVAISFDGMPVNMVSHAHGQGYADMHFIIPEVVDNIDFGKGPYYAYEGNFNTAGYVNLKAKKQIEDNLIALELGDYNTLRSLNLIKLAENDTNNAYLAAELLLSDGVFDSSQDFSRLNIMGRYNYNNREDEELTISISHFDSKWNASGQIPQRAVDQGLIGRFGAIDDTEGGFTGRSNIWVNHQKQMDEHNRINTKAYVSAYDFELFSNFTFFLEDPVNGDQIRQREKRTVVGAESRYNHSFHLDDHIAQLDYDLGIGFRLDDINEVELSRTRNRKDILERLAYGNTNEFNLFTYGQMNYKKGKWTFNPGLRVDYFYFDYEDLLSGPFSNLTERKVFVGPKLNMIYAHSQGLQLFAKTGYGFHSNDTRVVVAENDKKTLPGAWGGDIGFIAKPTDRMVINTAFWALLLEQEFVYVGDAGIVEPSGETRRLGVDFGFRYQLADGIFFNTDINYTYARSTEEPEGADFIPLAPDLTSAGGLTFTELGNFSGSINYRYIKDRPANEDNSIVAEGYFVNDLNLNYQVKNWTFSVIVENLFDVDWNETQFATESRLFNELAPVEEIHFTPGVPFFARGRVTVKF